MLASCQKEANDLPQMGNYPEDGVVRIATQLNALQTRATTSDYSGTTLSLSVDYGTGDTYTVHNNQWTSSGSAWSTATQMLWKSADAEAAIYAYAPFVDLGESGVISAVPFSVAADQSAGLTASDLVGFKNENYKPSDNNNANKAIPIAFAHKLAKLKVALTFGDQFGGSNPAITGVTIGGTLPSTTYDATTATAGVASGTATDIITYNNNGTYEAVVIPQTVTSGTRLVTIALANGDRYHYTISAAAGHAFAANTEYTINLRIGKDVVTLASPIQVYDWTTGAALADGETEIVPPAIGDYYYQDGAYGSIYIDSESNPCIGIVYWTDPDNEKHVKIVSLNELTGIQWSTTMFDVGIGEYADIRVEWPGDVNSLARQSGAANRVILNSFIATNSETYSIADFPAFKVADDKGDGWYLPALNELQYLYCAFKGAAPMTWQNNTPIGLVEDPDAADKFNTALDTAGTALATNNYWSATESNTDNAWYVNFNNGFTYAYYRTSNYRVRLVRDIIVP